MSTSLPSNIDAHVMVVVRSLQGRVQFDARLLSPPPPGLFSARLVHGLPEKPYGITGLWGRFGQASSCAHVHRPRHVRYFSALLEITVIPYIPWVRGEDAAGGAWD
jgi:hypothetical protein